MNFIVTEKVNYKLKMAQKWDNPLQPQKHTGQYFLGKRKAPNSPLLIVNDFVVAGFATKANLSDNLITMFSYGKFSYTT